MPHPIKVLDADIAYIEFYEDYVISSIKQDVVFDIEELNWFLMTLDKIYPNKKFGYIGNRINSYNMNPTTYLTSSVHERLSAMAIVCYNNIAEENAKYEGKFFSKPFEVFSNVEDAKKWVLEVLKK